jgi:hypothetical protein
VAAANYDDVLPAPSVVVFSAFDGPMKFISHIKSLMAT